MTSTAFADFASPTSISNAGPSLWHRTADFLVRRRIHISLIVFACLIAEDIATGVKPHDLTDFRDWHTLLGLTAIAAGLALRSWAAGTLHKWAELTTSGPYGIMRHPLYVGSFLMMVGFCGIIDDVENILFVAGPLLFMYLAAVRNEERKLAERYGALWTAYAAATPRFLPRRLPQRPIADWSGQQWLNNREYQAVATSLVGLLALQAWRLA